MVSWSPCTPSCSCPSTSPRWEGRKRPRSENGAVQFRVQRPEFRVQCIAPLSWVPDSGGGGWSSPWLPPCSRISGPTCHTRRKDWVSHLKQNIWKIACCGFVYFKAWRGVQSWEDRVFLTCTCSPERPSPPSRPLSLSLSLPGRESSLETANRHSSTWGHFPHLAHERQGDVGLGAEAHHPAGPPGTGRPAAAGGQTAVS